MVFFTSFLISIIWVRKVLTTTANSVFVTEQSVVGDHCLFPGHLAAQPQNNHTETALIKSLPGPLALASYWLTLTYQLSTLLVICV